MSQTLGTAAIRAEPDGYDVGRPRLLGRHVAGNGFLRAAVNARGDGPIYGYASQKATVEGFARLVRQIDPEARTEWIHADHLNRLGDPGVLYIADATVPDFARLRLRVGPPAFSICGVTHTTATSGTLGHIADLLQAPVAPWDALICTSKAVVETVRRVHEAETEHLRWRFGSGTRIEHHIQLPIIPLGVHCDDFANDDETRAEAREGLNLAPDEIASLYVGRLLFHGKAHPFPMYSALQSTAELTGKRIVLIMCGWSANDFSDNAFRNGAEVYAPDVRTIFVDGREPDVRKQAWRAADIFISLADGIQETFGLTPVEAMAAGLPVVVSDWNGYKDTVRDGVDGFRIKTWLPMAGMGQPIARAYESGSLDYDQYTWALAATVAVDIRELAERLTTLVMDPPLRRKMGDAGRRRALEVYDWTVVFKAYQALWGDLNARRQAVLHNPDELARWAAPRSATRFMDPLTAFGHYPSSTITPATWLELMPHASDAAFVELARHELFHGLLEVGGAKALIAALLNGPLTVQLASTSVGNPAPMARAAALLAKMGLVRLWNAGTDAS